MTVPIITSSPKLFCRKPPPPITSCPSPSKKTRYSLPLSPHYPSILNPHQGNDDQAFWAFAAMSAVERQFPSPPPTSPQWLPLAEAVFNDLSSRWDLSSCAGGLKWQIFSFNTGYDYKNVPSNGGLFQLAARLARYTSNSTYLAWAEKSWDWMSAVGLFDARFNVFDGTDDTINCTQVDHTTWTYNAGMLLSGASVLANYTNSPIWQSRTTDLLSAAATNFFSPYPNSTHIMYEPSCERASACNNDQFSFKAYLARWMAASTQMVPDLQPAVLDLLRASAQGAATSCSGGSDNQTCGTKWYIGGYDSSTGVGQQLSALEVVQALLVTGAAPPAVASGVQISLATATASVVLPTAVPVPKATGSSLTSGGWLASTLRVRSLGLVWALGVLVFLCWV